MSGTSAREYLSATVTGTGTRTLVFANGLGTSQATWRHVVAAFSPRVRCVRFDYLGTPASSLEAYTPEPYETLYGYADDLVGLLEELDVRDAMLVGHSVSGMVGLIAAVSAPERIARLAVISASPRYLNDGSYVGGFELSDIQGILASAEQDFHAWVSGFAPMVLGADAGAADILEFASYLRRMRPDIAFQTLRTIFLGDYRDVLPRVQQPVLLMQPQDDLAVPAAVGMYLHAHLKHAELVMLAARGHVPQLTAPVEVIATLERALAAWDA